MPKCIVLNCKNYTGQGRKNDMRFKCFPKDPVATERWRKLCGRRDKAPVSALICEEHFTDKQREHNEKCKKASGLKTRCRCRIADGDPTLKLPDKDVLKMFQVEKISKGSRLLMRIKKKGADDIPLKKRPLLGHESPTTSEEEDVNIIAKPVDDDNLSVFSGSEHSNDGHDSLDPQVFSLSELCRLCAHSGGDMVEIFGTEGQETKLADKINLCLPLKVSESDSLPLRVCRTCVSGVEQSHCLATACLDAQETLNKLLESNQRLFDETASYPADHVNKGLHSVVEEETLSHSPVLYIDEDAEVRSPSPDEDEQMSVQREQDSVQIVQVPLQNGVKHKFNCEICKLGFPTSDDVTKHCQIIHNKFMCDICFNIFDNHALLAVHIQKGHLFTKFIRNIHTNNNNNVENTVAVTESNNSLLNNSKSKKNHVCNVCWKIFDSNENFEKHINETEICNKQRSKDQSNSNVNTIQNGTDKSKILRNNTDDLNVSSEGGRCFQSLFRFKKYGVPTSYETPPKPKYEGQKMDIPCTLDCKICKENIPYHKLKVHYTAGHNSYICMICLDFQHSNIKLFKQHVLKKHKKITYKYLGTKYTCDMCKAVFNLKFQLEYHLKTKHVETTGRYICFTCNAFFRDSKAYKLHEANHRYECGRCKKIFKNQFSLKSHSKLNCTPNFVEHSFNKYNLRSEDAAQIESILYNYNCSICDKVFGREIEAVAHYGKHNLNEKLKNKNCRMYKKMPILQCRLCDLNCKLQQELIEHTKEVHGLDLIDL